MRTRLLKTCAVLCMLLFVFGCGGGGGGGGGDGSGGGGGGTTPPVDPGTTPPVAAKLDISADAYQLLTDGLDSAIVTVFTRDASNAALGGVIVDLEASAGTLSASRVTTDATGKATVTFGSSPEDANQVVTITASNDSLEKSLPITLLGTTLTLGSAKSSLLVNAGDTTTLTVSTLDGGGNPVPGAEITLTSAMGNNITGGGSTASSITVTTGAGGTATATLTALATPGIDTITATGLGAQTSLDINLTNAQFSFTSPADNSTLAVGATTSLTVTWTNSGGSPMIGQTITFTTTGGYFDAVIGRTSTTAATNGSGQATVTFTAGNTATPADISAMSGLQNDTLHLLVAATNPNRLSLQAAPSVLSPSIGEGSFSSTVTAIVRDGNGQSVSNETVVFSILSGPGGGESLSPGTAVTDAGGSAAVSFTSGSAVSAQNGVTIRATLQSNSAIYADTSLTIASKAVSIVLAGTNKISKISVDGLEVGYALPFSVLVVDINGNPVPNATVNLGIYPLYFYTGTVAGSRTGKFINEDQNRNGFLDAGEDGAQGWTDPLSTLVDPTDAVWYDGSEGAAADTSSGTPNGRLDPGGVVTIPASVVTDDNGLAAFQIRYAKAFGTWVDVEILATTSVYGDLSTSRLVTPLAVATGDSPYPDSPFGY